MIDEIEDEDFDQDEIARQWEEEARLREQNSGDDVDDWEEEPVIDFKSD